VAEKVSNDEKKLLPGRKNLEPKKMNELLSLECSNIGLCSRDMDIDSDRKKKISWLDKVTNGENSE